MTKIVYYLDCLQSARSYDATDLARLQAAFDSACHAFGFDATDQRRQQIALLVFALADKASSSDSLAEVVVAAFRQK